MCPSLDLIWFSSFNMFVFAMKFIPKLPRVISAMKRLSNETHTKVITLECNFNLRQKKSVILILIINK